MNSVSYLDYTDVCGGWQKCVVPAWLCSVKCHTRRHGLSARNIRILQKLTNQGAKALILVKVLCVFESGAELVYVLTSDVI